jgi:cell division protein FtsZ
MGNAGTALMGIGTGQVLLRDFATCIVETTRSQGKNRAVDAASQAVSSPLLDFPIEKARGIVFNIVGGSDLTLQEVRSAEGFMIA